MSDYVVFESTMTTPKVLSRHKTFDEAWFHVKHDPLRSVIERDFENKECADAYMSDGRILCIEPANRRGL